MKPTISGSSYRAVGAMAICRQAARRSHPVGGFCRAWTYRRRPGNSYLPHRRNVVAPPRACDEANGPPAAVLLPGKTQRSARSAPLHSGTGEASQSRGPAPTCAVTMHAGVALSRWQYRSVTGGVRLRTAGCAGSIAFLGRCRHLLGCSAVACPRRTSTGRSPTVRRCSITSTSYETGLSPAAALPRAADAPHGARGRRERRHVPGLSADSSGRAAPS